MDVDYERTTTCEFSFSGTSDCVPDIFVTTCCLCVKTLTYCKGLLVKFFLGTSSLKTAAETAVSQKFFCRQQPLTTGVDRSTATVARFYKKFFSSNKNVHQLLFFKYANYRFGAETRRFLYSGTFVSSCAPLSVRF